MQNENLSIVRDGSAREEQRVHAIHALDQDKSPEVISTLVGVLHDDDTGVRWAASTVLASFGEEALPQLLHALAGPDNDRRLCKSAHHVLSTSSSAKVRDESAALIKVLRGNPDSIKVMNAASELMTKLRIA